MDINIITKTGSLSSAVQSFLTIFCLLHVFTCPAQKAYQINTNNDLSGNNLTVVIKDKNNYMWIGSYDGVQKHEGARIKTYRHNSVDSLSLSSNEVHTLFEDREGFIWVGTMVGVDRIDPKSDVIRHYILKSYYAHEGNGYPNAIFQDKKDSIWVINGGGLFRINAKTGRYDQVEENNKNGNGIYRSQTGYKGSFATETGIWLYTGGGMVFYEYSTRKFHSKYYNPRKKKIFELEAGSQMVSAGEMCHDKKENLYFIANDSVLIKYNIQTEKTDSFHFARPPLSWQCCYSLACDYEDNIWIGFRMGGILVFDPIQSTFSPIRFEGINSLIGSNYIYSLAEDYLHQMWVTTNKGVYVVERHSTGIQQFYLSDKKEFIDLEYGAGIFTEDNSGNLYLPFNEGGLIVFNLRTGNTLHYPCTKLATSYSFLYPNYHNESWIASDNHLYRTTFFENKLKIDARQDLLTSLHIHPKQGALWMQKVKNTLFVKSLDRSIFVLANKKATVRLFTRNFMKQICLSTDSQYVYYINVRSNISRFHTISQKEDSFSIAPLLQKAGFNYDNPIDMADDGKGNIWIAYQLGLVRYNIAAQSIETYTMSKGLANEYSFALCVDRNKNVWVATLSGVGRYDAANDKFNTLYYLSSSTYLDAFGSGLLLKNGNVAFNIGNRLLLIDPDRLMQQPIAQKQLNVNEIEVNGKPKDVNSKNFSFPYDQNRLTVKFGLLDFENASKVNYWYNLDGSDNGWIFLGNHAELFFYSLSPGTYHLKVKAVDGSGNPVLDKINLTFVIRPPFYKATWFYSLLVLAAIISLLRTFFVIRSKYRQQKILTVFVASISTQTTVNDMAGGIAKNCVEGLRFTNCTMYILNDEKKVLQKEAYKSTESTDEVTPAEIVLGKGAAGVVSQAGTGEIKNITVVKFAHIGTVKISEIIVPIVAEGNVFGCIYSWSNKDNFYTKWHLHLLKEVALLSAVRISKYFTEERLRSAIARDLHDDLGSALSSINITSKMALQSVAKQTVVTDYLQKIKHNSGNMMEGMSDIVWAIDPQNDTLEKVIIHMKEFAAEILEPLDINYHFFEESTVEGLKLQLNQRKNSYLIFKESINNAAKYSGCTNLEVYIKINKDVVSFTIIDNGNGFDEREIHRGNGLRNMRERAAAMGAVLTITSENEAGTTIALRMPVT